MERLGFLVRFAILAPPGTTPSRVCFDLTDALMAMNARADDAQEGVCAFLDKRPPEWRGT
jgi:hypothetical protein